MMIKVKATKKGEKRYQIQYLNIMGSTDSIPQNNSLRLNRDNWELFVKEDVQPLRFKQGEYAHLKNKMTGEELNEYSLCFGDYDDYLHYLDILNFRNKCQSIVRVAHYNQEKVDQYCSLLVNLKVYIEHFPLRLCDIDAIHFPENLYVLSRALVGFKHLYEKLGHFHITQDLICINQQGIIKVWINSDLSSSSIQNVYNEPYYNRLLKKVEVGSQNSMVWQLVTILDQKNKCKSQSNSISFLKYLIKQNKTQLTFESTEHLLQSYSREQKISIPQVFQSTLKMIREKKGIFDSEVDLNLNRNRDQADFMIIGNRFKQSKVERVQSIKNNSVKSNPSQSNRTFADKLKSFDNRLKKKANLFGKVSGDKDSPLRQPSIMLFEQNQPFTQRVNLLSSSSLSFPQTQSLAVLENSGQNIVFPISNSNSDIVLQNTEKNVLALSQSPSKSKPQTYFSQYLDQSDQTNIVKKITLISFGQNQQNQWDLPKEQANNKIFRNAPISQSLENSQSQQAKIQKPMITFTYRQNSLSNLENRLREQQEKSCNAASVENSESNDEINSMPFSPPSVNKRSSLLEQAKPNCDLTQQKDYCKQPFDRSLYLLNKREHIKEVVESLCQKVNYEGLVDEHFPYQKSEGLVKSLKQKINYSIQQYLEESLNKKSQKKPFLKQKMDKYKQKDEIIQKKQLKVQGLETKLGSQCQWQQLKYCKLKEDEASESLTQYKQFQIDPDIIADLLTYQREEKRKKDKCKTQNRKHNHHLF